jgi:hypothetical protein
MPGVVVVAVASVCCLVPAAVRPSLCCVFCVALVLPLSAWFGGWFLGSCVSVDAVPRGFVICVSVGLLGFHGVAVLPPLALHDVGLL